jgi:hypothetical protein
MRSVMPWDNSKFWRMASKKGLEAWKELLEVDCEEGRPLRGMETLLG